MKYLKFTEGGNAIEWIYDYANAAVFKSRASAEGIVRRIKADGVSVYECAGHTNRYAEDKEDRTVVHWLIQHDKDWTESPPKLDRQSLAGKPMTQQQKPFNGKIQIPGHTPRSRPQATTPNPFQQQATGDTIDNLSNALSNAFSPGGLIAFGAGVFGSALLLNMGFWGSVLSQMPVNAHFEKMLMGEWAVTGAVLAGWGISWGTTLFQTYPYVGKKDGESIVKQYVASMFRPDLTKYKGGDHDIAQAHNQITSDFWKFMGVMWLVCTVLETLGGVIFIGDIFGKGLGSLLGIFGFIYSIAGCQWGAYLMIMGRNQRLNKDGRGVINQMNSAAAIAAKAQLK